MIDEHKGELKLCVQDEEVALRVFKVVEFLDYEEGEQKPMLASQVAKPSPSLNLHEDIKDVQLRM